MFVFCSFMRNTKIAARDALTQAQLKARMHYDPETGKFTRLSFSKRTDRSGKEPGYTDLQGRRMIGLSGHEYMAHRLAWLYMTGEWPTAGIDHKDGNPSNNVWVNLRGANQSQNSANARKFRSSASKLKGATFDRARRLWIAQITHQYKHIHIGRFPTEEDAHRAYCAKARELFGEFARFS